MPITLTNCQISVTVNIDHHHEPPERNDQGKSRWKGVLEWVGTIAAMVVSIGTILSNGGLF